MTFDEAGRMLRDIAGIHITALGSSGQREAFCQTWQFHRIQEYLHAAAVEKLLTSMEPSEVVCTMDCFQVRFAFAFAGDVPIALGPYRSEMISETDCAILLRRIGLDTALVQDVRAYRSPMPVMQERDTLHLLNCLFKALHCGELPRSVRHIRCAPALAAGEEDAVRLPKQQLVAERYHTEQLMMESIRAGNSIDAIQHWRRLHQYVDYLKKSLGETLDGARNSASITRTTIRLAAGEAGVPPHLNDLVSGKSAAIVRAARNVDEIDAEHERLIREYCQLIHRLNSRRYSALTLSVLYAIEHDYAQEFSIARLAEELQVNPNYLSTRFRKEAGMSPTDYLCQVRMKEAERLLTGTELTVQQVSEKVGVLDANYFTKLFKRAYGQTPVQYRRAHKL